MSITDDNNIVFAIYSKDGVNGILVDGVYAESLSDAKIQKLTIKR